MAEHGVRFIQLFHRGWDQHRDLPTQLAGQPFAMSRTPARMAAHPPGRGEHTDEILGGLGLSDHEIAGLRQRNII
jgi:formyl-CoA transferase